MGFFKRLAIAFGFLRHEVRVLVVGLDNSGKSTMVQHLKPKTAAVVETPPTIGFQVEEFTKNNLNFTVFDMSGHSRYRTLWEHYYKDVQAIIFVIDASDRVRLAVVRDELDMLLNNPDIHSENIPILFFANKMDAAGALTADQCLEELRLHEVGDKPWFIAASNAVSGEGVEVGIDWLCEQISRKSSRK